MLLPRNAIATFFLAAVFSMPAFGDNANSHTALPGTLNYVEGNVFMGSQELSAKSIGSAELQSGQSLTTEKGKAEILLTPGVFLRVGDNSAVKMISPSLTETEISLDKGHAMVEVAEIYPENDIQIDTNGLKTRLVKTGLYDFNLNQDQFRVFDGRALIEGPSKDVTVKSGHEVALAANQSLKPGKFDKKTYEEGDLYRWSSLRSAYVAEANVNAAGLYAGNGFGPWGAGWWGSDWYWDPWFSAFTFIPGDGIFYSPFGWGFYSPWWAYESPFWGGGFGFGYHPFPHHFSTDVHEWGAGHHYAEGEHYANGIYRGPGSSGGSIHSGNMMSGTRGFSGFAGAHGEGTHGGGFHSGGFSHGEGGGFAHGGGGSFGHGR